MMGAPGVPSHSDRRALARALTVVENRSSGHDDLLKASLRAAGHAHRVGITGAPGVGKSTLVSALLKVLRHQDKTVAILAVDPTSPVSGGALLGDRLRLNEQLLDSGVFFRSSASRGAHGGLSAATGDQLDLLDAAGFDVILIETVGAGQVDVDVAAEADTTLVVFAPGAGDSIQAMKSGIMEIADFWVVNKCDHDRAELLRSEILAALSLTERAHHADLESLVPLVSARTEFGIDQLAALIEAHRHQSQLEGRREARLAHRYWRRVHKRGEERMMDAWQEQAASTRATLSELRLGEITLDAAATRLLARAAEGVLP